MQLKCPICGFSTKSDGTSHFVMADMVFDAATEKRFRAMLDPATGSYQVGSYADVPGSYTLAVNSMASVNASGWWQVQMSASHSDAVTGVHLELCPAAGHSTSYPTIAESMTGEHSFCTPC